MKTTLNSIAMAAALDQTGLDRAGLAAQLGISGQDLASWEQGHAFPRPDQLLSLGLLLKLPYSDLVSEKGKPSSKLVYPAGVLLYRDQERLRVAAEGAGLLEPLAARLAPGLPDKALTPADADPDYEATLALAEQLRETVRMGRDAKLNVVHLAKMFPALRAVIIPVLWGECGTTSNLLQIRHRRSGMTWCYLNMDNTRHQVKKYLARHLGQILARKLESNKAATFVERFSRLLLFPPAYSKSVYRELIANSNFGARYNRIVELAKEHFLPPMTICRAINDYALAHEIEPLKIREVGGVDDKYNRQYRSMAQSLFGKNLTAAPMFIRGAAENFETPFFESLKQECACCDGPVGLVQLIMQISVLDAQAIVQGFQKGQGRKAAGKQKSAGGRRVQPKTPGQRSGGRRP